MALAIQKIIEVLSSIGLFSYGIGYLIHELKEIPWGAIYDWFHSAPAMSPQLGLGNEALYAQFQQLMDTQFQMGELNRIILTMPALPGEGY